MMISAAPPLGAPNLEQNDGPSSETKTANSGDDFSALLFLVFGTPQLQNISGQGDPQITAKGNGSAVFDVAGSLCASSLSQCLNQTAVDQTGEAIPAGTQTVLMQIPEQLAPESNDSVSTAIEEAPVGNEAPADQVRLLTNGLEEASPMVVATMTAQPGETSAMLKTDSAAPLMAGSLTSPTMSPVLGQDGVAGSEPGNPPDRIDQKGFNSLARQNLTLDRRASGMPFTADLKTMDESRGPQDQEIAHVAIDSNANKTSLASSASDSALEQPYLAQATPTQQNSAPVLSSGIQPAIKDAQRNTRFESGTISPDVNKISGNLGSAAAVPKALAATDQNQGFAFDNHGEKTFGEAAESNHDHQAESSHSPTISPAIGMHNLQNLKSNDVKVPPSPVIEQIADGIATNVRQNKRDAVIMLDPPELGGLKINLSLDGGKVQIHIIAESHESRSLIENHLPELKQALQLHHLDLVDARVESGTWNATGRDLMQGFQHDLHSRQEWGENFKASLDLAGEPAEAQGQDAALPATGRVSMWA